MVAGCAAATDGASLTSQAATPNTTTPAITENATPTELPVDWGQVESVATGFMLDRQERDVAGAQAYLSENVVFDWGPNNGRDGLAAAWAWEDAFSLTHTLQECEALRDRTDAVARCRLRVDSEVARAAGMGPGFVCIDVTVDHDLITGVVALDSAPGCTYDYWSMTFQPFAGWLESAHPEISIGMMYDDRISDEGLKRWQQYTSEFIADRSG